ncbi:MAG TPA: hypothetical protein DDZ33_09215 [Clostridium sp.]|nr:hypothetical protein [Clostridium sp.]
MLKYPISVFVDTNIFINAKYDFSSKGSFNILTKYVNEDKIKLFISNIVESEVKKHINEDASKFYNIFKNARKEVLKKISLNLLEDTSISELFKEIEKDTLEIEMISFFDKFKADSKVIVLDSRGVDCNQIISDYFSSTPPFEQKDSKKHEFPDAIMAAKLKSLFNTENPICIISSDLGFRSSFEEEEGFTTFKSLKEVFDLINKETKIYKDMIGFIDNSDTHKFICNKLTEELNDKEIDVDGSDFDRKGVYGGYNYEEVYIDDISQVEFEFSSIDNITEDTVNITLSCKASITATCSYLDESNSAWDSEEDEYIYSEWGSIEEKHQPNFECEVIFSIIREDEDINFELKSIHFDISLDQNTRVERRDIEPVDPAEMAEVERMEALEEYYRH